MYKLLAALALGFGLAAPALPTQSTETPPQKKEKRKVWTNDDLEELRNTTRWGSGGGSSTGTTAETTGEEKPGEKPKPLPKEKDPKAYQQRLAPLRAQLDQVDAQIRQLRDTLEHPVRGTNKVDLGHTSATMRPEELLAGLEKQRQQIQQKIDEIEEEARRNGISPGEIR